MRSHKLSLLAGCITLAVSSASWAAQSDTHAHLDKKVHNVSKAHINVAKKQGRALLPGINENTGLGPIFDDAHANIKLRTVYFNQHLPKGTNTDDQAWRGSAFGAQFNFHSGYAFNHVGFDWSAFSSLLLSTGGNQSNAKNQFSAAKANGKLRSTVFTPDGLADIKFKAGDKNLNVKGKLGYVSLSSEFFGTSGSRSVPSSYRGANINGDIHGVKLYANVANAMRTRTNRGMQNFKSTGKKKISYIAEVGGQYTFNNGLGLKAAYGTGHNYVKLYTAAADYMFNLPATAKLKLHGQTYYAKKGGSLWDSNADGFKSSSFVNSISANYLLDGLNAGFAYSKTKAKGGQGHFNYLLANNDYGNWNAATSVDSDFDSDGENAYQASADYKFDKVGVPGLEAAVIYTLGTGIDTSNHNIGIKGEHEIDYSVSYAFQQPALKGLSFKAVDYDLYQKGANGHGNSHLNDLRVYADYTIAVF